MAERFKRLGDLGSLRERLAGEAAAERLARTERARIVRRQAHDSSLFRDAMEGVTPLAPSGQRRAAAAPHAPLPHQRQRDDRAALAESVSEEIDIETLLDTDDTLSYRRAGVGPEALRRLRRGHWVIQDQLDLHGHRVDEARLALGRFVREACRHGLRCVRVIHGKGLGSKDREPVLKSRVRGWLAQRDEVLAFCQPRPAEGGAGALVVLLRPGGGTER
ncbi:MAG TPA: Smr/MutS family protein, partial [Burkholderiaceae bacterium]